MVRNIIVQTCVQALFGTLVTMLSLSVVVAQVRVSPSYQIQSDSINVGGGFSSSTLYTQESTVGEIATGRSASASYQLRAGYQQMQESFISLTLSSSSLTLLPTLSGLTGGDSSGSTTATVVTDSPGGYELRIAASDSPAMRKGVDVINDYAPAVSGTPDFNFMTDATDAHFAFSPEGDDIVERFQDDGVGACNVPGGDTADRCWDGLTTSDSAIARGAGANYPAGDLTTIQFRVGLGGSVTVVPGEYVATTTLTALPL